jgi:uncharacterized protein YkwD
MATGACWNSPHYVWLARSLSNRDLSGVVVHDEGSVTSKGLRIASATAAVVVSAAVAGALFGGSAISDSRVPSGQDERLVAVPASPSPSAEVTPSATVTPSGASTRSLRARAHARPECQVNEKKPAICHRQPTRRSTATPARSSKSPSTAPTVAKRSRTTTSTTKKTQSFTPTPTKTPTQETKSPPSKTTTQSTSGYTTRSDWANAVLDELNAERARHDLTALKMNSDLVSAAHKHNLAMAKANTLSHQLEGEAALGSRVSAAGYRWSAVGENVAYNGRRSEDGVLAVQKAMYNETPPNDGHRKNILSKTYVDVGIDVISDSVHDKVWLVTDFGKP